MSKDTRSILEQLGGTPDPISTDPLDALTASEPDRLARAEEIVASKGLGYEPPDLSAEAIQEVAATSEQIYEAAKNDLDFLAALCMPLVFEFAFPPVFLSVWQWLLGYAEEPRIFPQLALGLPRGFGKTTLIKIFILYCILFTKKKFILIIGATGPLAQNILADVVDMLNEPNIKRTFGDWSLGVEKDTQDLKKFGFRGRNIILAALGAEGSLRGLNLKNERPDIMIFEDIQTREQADSEVQSSHLEDWMIGTAMKAKSPKGCMFLFVGNMYPTKYSILRKLKGNYKWTKFIAGGILADGTSLWEDLQPIKQLFSEFENDFSMGKPEIFYSEVLNDENASINNLVNISMLPAPPDPDIELDQGAFIVVDPSNDKANSDAVSIGAFKIYDGRPLMRTVLEGRLSPHNTIVEAIRMALKIGARAIFIEANAYQYSLIFWCTYVCEQLQITGIHFEPIYSGSVSKNARILGMFKELNAGDIYLHPDVMAATAPQITSFNALRRDNTDGILDCLTYAPRVVAEFSYLLASLTEIESQDFDAMEVIEHNSSF